MINEIKKDCLVLLLEKEGHKRERQKKEQLSINLSFQDGKIYNCDTVCGSYDEKDRIIILDQQKASDSRGRNLIAKHPSLPSCTAVIVKNRNNTHTFITDSLARIIYQKDEINEKSRENSRRDSNEQTKAKLFNDESGFVDTPKKLKDQGGHACPASAGGLKEMINIFPQAFIINNGKEWKDQENKMRRLYKTEEPFVVETIREYNGKSRRPTLIRRSVNDESFTFNNLNSERLKFFSCQQH
jgi:hypothetical protein